MLLTQVVKENDWGIPGAGATLPSQSGTIRQTKKFTVDTVHVRR